jgi:hypothetical protein
MIPDCSDFLMKIGTARSFGGLRMTMMGWRLGDDASLFLLSSYVCISLFNRQNSQILRRPQDDNDGVEAWG